MPLTADQETLVKEAKIRDARAQESMALGQLALTAAWSTQVSSMNAAASKAYSDAKASREALESMVGVSSIDGYGPYSAVDTLLQNERYAGKSGCIDYVKANPSCSLQDAIAAWTTAALAATGRSALIQDPAQLQAVYADNLVAAGLIADATWASQAAWIVATDKTTIMNY